MWCEKLTMRKGIGGKNIMNGIFDWDFWRCALIRGIRTFAESMLAYIGTGAVVLGDVQWVAALSAGAMGFVVAILLALAGLPEVGKKEIEYHGPITEEDQENE